VKVLADQGFRPSPATSLGLAHAVIRIDLMHRLLAIVFSVKSRPHDRIKEKCDTADGSTNCRGTPTKRLAYEETES